MALLTLPAIAPSMGSGLKEKARLLKVKLGDGYEQVATDGINSILASYEARWQNRTLAELDTLVAFFRARQGVQVFLFTVPGEEAPRRWRCEGWRGPYSPISHLWQLTS